jgi:hypothetical protein
MDREEMPTKWNGSLLEALQVASGISEQTIQKNVQDLADVLNIEMPEVGKRRRKEYRSFTVKAHTVTLLERIKDRENQPSISATVHYLSELYFENKMR